MYRKQKVRLAAMLLLKNYYLLGRKLKILLLKLLHNLKMVHALATIYLNVLLQVGIAEQQAEIRERQLWKFNRNSTLWENDVLTMEDTRFKENFHLNREAFRKVCGKVQNIQKLDTNMRPCIPLDKRVAIELFALGSSAEYRTVGSLFGVGRSTVVEIVLDFCHAICNNLAHFINSYPPHPQEIKRIVDGYEHLEFPQCFGAVDGCHIEIQPKKEDAVGYYNYKGWYSVILLASYDHRSKFTYKNIGSSGENNDSYIFEKSSLKRFHESTEIFAQYSKLVADINVPLLLIGDSAFPYSINQPDAEKTFNYRLSRYRRIIENAFGQLKARFRRIGRGLQVTPKNVNIIMKTCCILRNFFKMENDEVSSAWIESAATELITRSQPNHSTRDVENHVAASTIRNAIALSFMNEDATAADDIVVSRGDGGEEGDETFTGDGKGCDTGDGNGCDTGDGNGFDSIYGKSCDFDSDWQLASGVFT